MSEVNKPAKKFNRNLLAFIALCPLVVLTIVTYFFAMQWKERLPLDQVLVEGTHILSPKEIVTLANVEPQGLVYGQNLFMAERKILLHPMVKSATINRELANSVRIDIVEREPLASLSSGKNLFYIDADGVLLPREATTVQFDLPIISGIAGIDTMTFGSVIHDTDLTQAIEILQSAQLIGFYHSISEVNMKPGADPMIYAAENAVPIAFGRGNIGKKLAMLQTFWNGAVNPGNVGQLQYVDARFEGQVIAKWATKSQPAKAQL